MAWVNRGPPCSVQDVRLATAAISEGLRMSLVTFLVTLWWKGMPWLRLLGNG